MRPTQRSASPPRPLPKRQATGRPWTETVVASRQVLRDFSVISSVFGAEPGKGSSAMDLPNPTSPFPLVASFATNLRTQSVRGRDGRGLGGARWGDTRHRGKISTLRG